MKAAKKVLRVPAIKLPNGRVVRGRRGQTHADLIGKLKSKPRSYIGHGFIGTDGKYHSREQARARVRKLTGRSLHSGRPDSRDLMKRKKR